MLIPELALPRVVLEPGDDRPLARAVEAGVYAQHLIDEGATHPRLPLVVARGREAAEQFAWVGIRMALKYALRTASVSGLPADELFQDGCLAVAEAVRRFDYAHNYRFTTFVHEYLFRELCDAGRHRIGHPMVSRADRRAARQVVREMEALGVEHSPATLDAVVSATGLSMGATKRGHIRLVTLDEVLHTDETKLSRVEDQAALGLDFLALLTPRHRRILQLRYGLNGEVQTLSQVAGQLKASPSTVARWEREALTAARHLLSQDRTTTAAAYREETAAVG